MSNNKSPNVSVNDKIVSFNVSVHDVAAFIESLRSIAHIGHIKDDPCAKGLADLEQMMHTGQTEKFWPTILTVLAKAKSSQDEQQKNTQKAFNDLVLELMNLERDMLDSFTSATQALSQSGVQYDKQMTDYMGGLAHEINQASSLTSLKTSAVTHLSKMRESIKKRRVQEETLMEANSQEILRLNNELQATRDTLNTIEAQSKQIEEAALTCPLTSVGNKRAMDKLLTVALKERAYWPFCLAVLDVDHFKHFNDNFGHQAGDKVLMTMTQQVLANMRAQDSFFRYAGDEFVLVFRQLPLDKAFVLADQIRAFIEAIRFKYKNEMLRITISMGLTQARENDTIATLFERADLALLDSKRKDRNCVSTFEN